MQIIPLKKYDTIGALSSGLCIIHCLATPFFFIAATCSTSCCNTTPLWWQWIDYAFLLISFVAVKQAAFSTKFKLIKYGLWISWIILFLLILNIKFSWFYISSQNIKFIPAFTLIVLHLYNLRYNKCPTNNCC